MERTIGRVEEEKDTELTKRGTEEKERDGWTRETKRGKRIGHGIQRAAILRAGLHKMHCNPCSQCGKLKFYLLV